MTRQTLRQARSPTTSSRKPIKEPSKGSPAFVDRSRSSIFLNTAPLKTPPFIRPEQMLLPARPGPVRHRDRRRHSNNVVLLRGCSQNFPKLHPQCPRTEDPQQDIRRAVLGDECLLTLIRRLVSGPGGHSWVELSFRRSDFLILPLAVRGMSLTNTTDLGIL